MINLLCKPSNVQQNKKIIFDIFYWNLFSDFWSVTNNSLKYKKKRPFFLRKTTHRFWRFFQAVNSVIERTKLLSKWNNFKPSKYKKFLNKTPHAKHFEKVHRVQASNQVLNKKIQRNQLFKCTTSIHFLKQEWANALNGFHSLRWARSKYHSECLGAKDQPQDLRQTSNFWICSWRPRTLWIRDFHWPQPQSNEGW